MEKKIADCRSELPGSPCGTSALCGTGICDEFERCVDRPLCAAVGASPSDVRYIAAGMIVVVATVALVAIAIAIAFIVMERRRGKKNKK